MSQQAKETVVVPREPTPEMIEAAHRATPVTFLMDCDPTNIWWAMTRAAPVSPDSDLLKEAVGLLRVFADAAGFWEPIYDDSEPMMKPAAYVDRWKRLHGRKAVVPQFTVGDLRKARAFLSKVEERGHD